MGQPVGYRPPSWATPTHADPEVSVEMWLNLPHLCTKQAQLYWKKAGPQLAVIHALQKWKISPCPSASSHQHEPDGPLGCPQLPLLGRLTLTPLSDILLSQAVDAYQLFKVTTGGMTTTACGSFEHRGFWEILLSLLPAKWRHADQNPQRSLPPLKPYNCMGPLRFGGLLLATNNHCTK